jgi:hypothetical protein
MSEHSRSLLLGISWQLARGECLRYSIAEVSTSSLGLQRDKKIRNKLESKRYPVPHGLEYTGYLGTIPCMYETGKLVLASRLTPTGVLGV